VFKCVALVKIYPFQRGAAKRFKPFDQSVPLNQIPVHWPADDSIEHDAQHQDPDKDILDKLS
jgi:hypothetical protein